MLRTTYGTTLKEYNPEAEEQKALKEQEEEADEQDEDFVF